MYVYETKIRIHYALTDQMGENARGVALEKFEINKIAQQFETFLKQKIN